jgi:hypothetical protein
MDQVDLKTVAMMEKLPGIVVEATQGPLHYLYTSVSNLPRICSPPSFCGLRISAVR